MSTFQIRNDGMFDPEGKYTNPINGLPYNKHYKETSKRWSTLKAYEDRMKILQKIHSKYILLVLFTSATSTSVSFKFN